MLQGLHPNGREFLVTLNIAATERCITRRQKAVTQKDLIIVPAGLGANNLPKTVLDSFAYSAAAICNDNVIGIGEEMCKNFVKFRSKLSTVDLCRVNWCINNVSADLR